MSILPAVAVMSGVGFVGMAYDKNCARNRSRRVPNVNFYLISLAFGAPGVLLAMKLCRHKTQKPKYWFFVTVGIILDIYLLFFQKNGSTIRI